MANKRKDPYGQKNTDIKQMKIGKKVLWRDHSKVWGVWRQNNSKDAGRVPDAIF